MLPTTGQPLATAVPDGGGGRAGQVARLEADVGFLRARLGEASLAGDVVLERAIRKQVVAAEDTLRKALESAPTELGGSGELIAKAQVVALLEGLGYALNAALRSALAARAQELAATGSPSEVAVILGQIREAAIPAALVALAGLHVAGARVPEWALESIGAHWGGREGKRAEWLADSRATACELVAKLIAELEAKP